MPMLISGLQKLTLLDFPGTVACTVFTGGCNFRCPFCHNASLVLPERLDGDPDGAETVLAFLKKRQGILEGVAITDTFVVMNVTQLAVAAVVLGLMYTRMRAAATRA